MYIYWDIEEETIKNIITALSSEMSLERYRKEEALERLKEAEENASANDSLRETVNQLNDEKRELESKLEGSQAVIDDLLKENEDMDARIKVLTDESTALQATIRAMSERLAIYNPVADKKNGYGAACEASSRATDVYTDVQG